MPKIVTCLFRRMAIHPLYFLMFRAVSITIRRFCLFASERDSSYGKNFPRDSSVCIKKHSRIGGSREAIKGFFYVKHSFEVVSGLFPIRAKRRVKIRQDICFI